MPDASDAIRRNYAEKKVVAPPILGGKEGRADNTSIRWPAEWELQSGVQLTWPHPHSDWEPILDEALPCFAAIAREIAKREICLIVCHDREEVANQIGGVVNEENLRLVEIESNDSWARDHAPLSIIDRGSPQLLDFVFNGWGMKFAAEKDNLITHRLWRSASYHPAVAYRGMRHYVLEGGSVESDGCGTMLTTETCLLSPNRNPHFRRDEIESVLKESLGLHQILWLRHGWLAGDDTDSHIDTLARFCSPDTIAYVRCDDPLDEHYRELRSMERELSALRQLNGHPYNLLPLPMADAVYHQGKRLPATYANFLIINGAVLTPAYGTARDMTAREQLGKAFPDREIVGIDCRPLIREHGSLHCVTMQYPAGFLV